MLPLGMKKKNVLNDVNARMGTFNTKENVSKKNSVQVKYKYVCLYVCLVSFQYYPLTIDKDISNVMLTNRPI